MSRTNSGGAREAATPQPVIETERLMLRPLVPDDAGFILELLNEAAFIRFIGDKGVRTLSDAREYLLQGPIDSYARHGFGLYAACLRQGTPLGICGLVKRDGLADADIGFAFLGDTVCRDSPPSRLRRYWPTRGGNCGCSASSPLRHPTTMARSPSSRRSD